MAQIKFRLTEVVFYSLDEQKVVLSVQSQQSQTVLTKPPVVLSLFGLLMLLSVLVLFFELAG